MKKKFYNGTICVMILGLLLASCATRSNKISQLQVGMTPSQVTSIMGTPSSKSVDGNKEGWHYINAWNGDNARVYFMDDKVTSFSGYW
jgi:outer membrane protein assembly factor BamE (lipoprotein component of BamABCDE complex)